MRSYSWYGQSEEVALRLVAEACTYLYIYPEPVCRGMVTSVGSRLFSILRLSNVEPSRASNKGPPVITNLRFCDYKPSCGPSFEALEPSLYQPW